MDKNKFNLYIGLISYIIAFILIFYYLIIEFSIYSLSSPIKRLLIIWLIVTFMYFGSIYLRRIENKIFVKLPKFNLYIWFILYVIMLLNLTLFDNYFGRSGGVLYTYDYHSIKNYLTYNFNMVPFKTINNYVLAFKNNNISFINMFYNIFGNMIAFMPLAFFLPRIFKNEKWYVYFMFTTICIIFVEAMQLATNCGSFDIDDYILNILGFVIMYILLNNKWSRKGIDWVLML